MAAVWRCNWCGRKQPIETLDEAIQGSHVIRGFGLEIEISIHNCSPEHDRKTRDHLALMARWTYPFTAGSLLAVACLVVSSARELLWLVGAVVVTLGALLLLAPAARNTVKMDPSTKHGQYRWLGDLLMSNRAPGDLLVSWRTCIVTARVMGAAAVVLGLLLLVGILK